MKVAAVQPSSLSSSFAVAMSSAKEREPESRLEVLYC